MAFVLGPGTKTATLKLLQRRLRVSEREAEEGFTDIVIGMDKKPYPSMEGLRNIQRLMKIRNPKLEKAKVEIWLTTRSYADSTKADSSIVSMHPME
jgi:hypothetical protein